MRFLSSVAGLILVSACGGDGTKLRGGSFEQRQVVMSVLEETRDASSFELRVSSIRLGNVLGGAGRYRTTDRTIALDEDVSLKELEVNLRHELCHAYDFQIGLQTDDDPFWTFASPTLLDSYGTRRGRREAFAQVCAHGPSAWSRVGACTDDGDSLVAYRDALFDLAQAAPPFDVEPISSLPVPDGLRFVRAMMGEHGMASLELRSDPDQLSEFWIVDPFTMEAASPTGDLILRNPVEIDRPGPWRLDGAIALGPHIGGAEDWTTETGHTFRNAFWQDADGVERVRCVEQASDFLLVDGELWFVEQRDGALHFGVVSE